MGSIPLVAESIRPPEDQLGQLQKLMAIKSLVGQQALQPGQLQQQQQQIQATGLENQQRQIQLQDQKAQTAAMQEWDGKDLNELPSLILKHGGSAMAVFGAKNQIVSYTKNAAEAQDAVLKNQATQNDLIAGHLENVKSAAPDQKQQVFESAVTDLEQKGLLKPNQIPHQYPGDDKIDALEKTFMGQKSIVDQEMKKREVEAQEQTAQSRATSAQTQANEFKAKMPGGALADVGRTEMQDWLAKNPGKGPSDYEVAMKKVVPAFTLNMQASLLSPQAKDMAAENYFQTGQLPAGMRSPAMSAAIISRAAELHPNGTTELAGNRAAYEANKKSYDNVTGTLDTLSAFEQSGLKNLKQFTDLANKLPDTGVPWLNTPVRNLNQNLVGAQYMPAIEAARSVALREIARVTNDPKLSGSLTDSARQEVSSFSPANATLPQIKHVVEVLQNDMANVHSSLAAQKADIGARLGIKAASAQGGGGQPGNGASSAPAGMTRIKASDGSLHDIPSDKLDLAKKRDPGLQVQ